MRELEHFPAALRGENAFFAACLTFDTDVLALFLEQTNNADSVLTHLGFQNQILRERLKG